MEQVKGIEIANLGINLERHGDLLYHEGPLLSHFINKDNHEEHYFYKWTDCDEFCNRWLIFRVSIENLKSFFEKKHNLLQLINQNPFIYFIDLDNDLNPKNVLICSTNHIPTDYLPSENSFFQENQYEKYAMDLKQSLYKETANDTLLEIVVREIQNIKASQYEQNRILTSLSQKMNLQVAST